VKPGAASDFDGGSDLFALALGAASAPHPPDRQSGGASLLAVLEFAEQRLAAVQLQPLEVDTDGVPRIAAEGKRAEIFEDLARFSAGSGTVIQTAGRVTTVVLPSRQPRP
jgi:hypothetical protein